MAPVGTSAQVMLPPAAIHAQASSGPLTVSIDMATYASSHPASASHALRASFPVGVSAGTMVTPRDEQAAVPSGVGKIWVRFIESPVD